MVRTFKSEKGNLIQVGQNAKENDQIRKFASQKDIWFHLENTSSPHVILSVAKEAPSLEEIHECCQLVKYYSKLKDMNCASVIYIHCKQVKKVNDVDGLVELKSKPEKKLVYDDDYTISRILKNQV